jgi:hypothetical protein
MQAEGTRDVAIASRPRNMVMHGALRLPLATT